MKTDDEFTIRSNGSIGYEILNAADGLVIAWTVDAVMAAVICKLLNESDTSS